MCAYSSEIRILCLMKYFQKKFPKVFIFQTNGKFWSDLLEHFIKLKHLFFWRVCQQCFFLGCCTCWFGHSLHICMYIHRLSKRIYILVDVANRVWFFYSTFIYTYVKSIRINKWGSQGTADTLFFRKVLDEMFQQNTSKFDNCLRWFFFLVRL